MSSAELIVTYNIADFPAQALAPYDVEASHPGDFPASLVDLNAAVVV